MSFMRPVFIQSDDRTFAVKVLIADKEEDFLPKKWWQFRKKKIKLRWRKIV